MLVEYAVARIPNVEGTKFVLILKNRYGRFRFIEYSQKTDRGRSYWGPSHWSATYATAGEALSAVGETLPWTRAQLQAEPPPPASANRWQQRPPSEASGRTRKRRPPNQGGPRPDRRSP